MTMQQRFWAILHKALPWSVIRHVCDLCSEFGFDPADEAEWDRRIADGRLTKVQVIGPPPGWLLQLGPARTFATGASVITYTFKG